MDMTAIAEGTILSQRQLNRTLLARQHLLRRSDLPVAEMIAHLCGMQSQVPTDPYTGLWTRLREFSPDELSRLMLDRTAVRASLMRGTIHLATSDDFLRLQPTMRPLHHRAIRSIASTRDLAPECVPDILAAGRDALAATPMTIRTLGIVLGERFPDLRPAALAQACRFGLPLVQTTPRGTWGASHQPTWALASEWLGTPVPDETAIDDVLMGYLAAFGPATIADMQAWSGLTRLRETIARIRPLLRVFRNEQGQELFDMPDAPIVDADTPAPVRFLPEFDNALLSHKDRTRIIAEDRRKAIGTVNGRFAATYLVDGFVGGTWTIATSDDIATLVLTPFEPHARKVMGELEEEGTRLLRFLGVEPDSTPVTFTLR